MTIWQPFGKEMLKHKYLHSILQQNKFNAINIFGLDIVWCFVIEGNVHQKYGSSSSYRYLLSASWQLSQEQNKTNDPEIHWKIRTVTLSQNYLVLTKRSVFYFESSSFMGQSNFNFSDIQMSWRHQMHKHETRNTYYCSDLGSKHSLVMKLGPFM